MRVVVVGSTPIAAKIIQAIPGIDGCELVGVIGLHPRLGAAKSNYQYLPGSYSTDSVCDCDTRLKSWKPDVIVQAGWNEIWPQRILDIPTLFCIGVHPSPLPEGRGAAVLNWKIIEGGCPWGVSLFVMEEKTDTGPVLDFEPFEIEPRDDIRTAYLKADHATVKMIQRTLLRIADGDTSGVTQRGAGSRYYKRTPKDGKMEFDWSAEKICRYVRALTHPYPGAFFATRYGQLIVWDAHRTTGAPPYPVGRIATVTRSGLIVNTGGGEAVRLDRITPPDGHERWADEWATEMGLSSGDLLLPD